jgi:uncharacterized alkaline shock family protein YloU
MSDLASPRVTDGTTGRGAASGELSPDTAEGTSTIGGSVVAAPVATPAPTEQDRVDRAGRAAADAALAVAGVHHLGSSSDRRLAGLRATVTGRDVAPGVRVGRSIDGPTVRVSIVVEYPAEVHGVAGRVREAVESALKATAAGPYIVDIVVTDVHGPFDRETPVPDVVEPPKARTVDVRAAADSAVETVQGAASDAADTIKDAAATAADRVQDAAATAADRVQDVAASTADAVQDAAATGRARAQDAAADTADATSGAASRVVDAVRDGAAAVAARADAAEPAQPADGEQVVIRTSDGTTTVTGDDVVVVVAAPDAATVAESSESSSEREQPAVEKTSVPESDDSEARRG